MNVKQNIPQKSQAKRQRNGNFVLSIIGTNRTGKTTEAKKIIRNWKKNNPEGTIIAFDPQSKMTGMYNSRIQDANEAWCNMLFTRTNTGDYVCSWNVKNGCLIVLDDYRILHEEDKTEHWLRILMNFREEWNMDFIYICHSPSLVLNYLTMYTNYYYIFYTKAIDKKWKDRIPDYDLCIKATTIMQLYVNKYGKGEYPKFPHCIVDCENNKLIIQNISQERWSKLNNLQNNIQKLGSQYNLKQIQ